MVVHWDVIEGLRYLVRTFNTIPVFCDCLLKTKIWDLEPTLDLAVRHLVTNMLSAPCGNTVLHTKWPHSMERQKTCKSQGLLCLSHCIARGGMGMSPKWQKRWGTGIETRLRAQAPKAGCWPKSHVHFLSYDLDHHASFPKPQVSPL